MSVPGSDVAALRDALAAAEQRAARAEADLERSRRELAAAHRRTRDAELQFRVTREALERLLPEPS